MRVSLKNLQNLTRQLYLKLEYPEAQTETILDVLSYAHRRGNFQSLIQEVAVGTPRFNAPREMVVEKETLLSCLIDAGGNIGICALHLAADLLVSKARTSGFAIQSSRVHSVNFTWQTITGLTSDTASFRQQSTLGPNGSDQLPGG